MIRDTHHDKGHPHDNMIRDTHESEDRNVFFSCMIDNRPRQIGWNLPGFGARKPMGSESAESGAAVYPVQQASREKPSQQKKAGRGPLTRAGGQ